MKLGAVFKGLCNVGGMHKVTETSRDQPYARNVPLERQRTVILPQYS